MRFLKLVKGIELEDDEVTAEKSELISEKLVEAIDAHIAQEYIKIRTKPITTFHPSNTNECARFLVYKFRGVPIPPTHDSRVQRIFDNGNDFHARLTRYFTGMGVLLGEEVRFTNDDPPISGYIDDVIQFEEKPYIVEAKSIGDQGFAMRKSYRKPKDDHYRQIQIYLHCMEVKEGFIIYENKNNQELLAFHIEYDPEFIAKLFKRWRKIHKIYTDGKLPKRPYKRSSDNCKWCDLKDFCWNDEDEGV